MSVIYFSDAELKRIYDKLNWLAVDRVDFSPQLEEPALRRWLVRLGLSNRLAYRVTYHDGGAELTLAIPDLEVAAEGELALKQLIEQLELLDYNCITNGGQCFADQQDLALLNRLVDSLRCRYVRELEWELNREKHK